jgi:hypothetical protein
MKWNQLPDPGKAMTLTLVDTNDALPILKTGQTAGSLWLWTGDDSHLLRLEGATYTETSGDQGEIHGSQGQVIGYIAAADDVPEIADLPTYLSTFEQLRAQTETESFKIWLDDEIAITK